MNVLIDATPLSSGHRWRGIGTYVRHLAQGLLEALPEGVRFLTLAGSPSPVPSSRALPFARDIPPRFDDLWILHTRRVAATVAASGASIYHFTSAEASLRPRAIKCIATVYDLIPLEERRPSVDPRAVWRRLLYRLYLRRLRAADYLIAISRSTAQSITERLDVPAERITVVPLGIDREEYLERARQTPDGPRQRYRAPDRYWLTVTSPNPNKGWPDLLRALADTRRMGSSTPLLIAGHWLPAQRWRVEQEAQRLGIASLTRFLGYVPDQDLPALYAQAYGFVFPSHREGFGLPVLEAMALGTPVVVADDPAVMEIAEGASLVFPRGDSAAMAEAMRRLGADPSLHDELAAKGRERSARFSWERTVTETLRVYQRLAE